MKKSRKELEQLFDDCLVRSDTMFSRLLTDELTDDSVDEALDMIIDSFLGPVIGDTPPNNRDEIDGTLNSDDGDLIIDRLSDDLLLRMLTRIHDTREIIINNTYKKNRLSNAYLLISDVTERLSNDLSLSHMREYRNVLCWRVLSERHHFRDAAELLEFNQIIDWDSLLEHNSMKMLEWMSKDEGLCSELCLRGCFDNLGSNILARCFESPDGVALELIKNSFNSERWAQVAGHILTLCYNHDVAVDNVLKYSSYIDWGKFVDKGSRHYIDFNARIGLQRCLVKKPDLLDWDDFIPVDQGDDITETRLNFFESYDLEFFIKYHNELADLARKLLERGPQ